MTETTYPYEALLAFCQTKGPAFDGFMRDWNRDHPTIAPALTIQVEPVKPKVKPVAPKHVEAPKPETASVEIANASTVDWGASK